MVFAYKYIVEIESVGGVKEPVVVAVDKETNPFETTGICKLCSPENMSAPTDAGHQLQVGGTMAFERVVVIGPFNHE